MKTQKRLDMLIIATMSIIMTGCNEDEHKRLAEMAERDQVRQVEQSRQIVELQHEVAEGSRRLVEADAQARQEMIALQREVQSERTEVGQQRDALEIERRSLASSRQLAPLVATAITSTGLLVACMLPLVLGWYLLQAANRSACDSDVAEVLLEDLVLTNPQLLSRVDLVRGIEARDEPGGPPRLADEFDAEEPPF